MHPGPGCGHALCEELNTNSNENKPGPLIEHGYVKDLCQELEPGFKERLNERLNGELSERLDQETRNNILKSRRYRNDPNQLIFSIPEKDWQVQMNQPPLQIPEKYRFKYPNLGSFLDQMVNRFEQGELTAQEAAQTAPLSKDGAVAVTIRVQGDVDHVIRLLEKNGGSPRNDGLDYIEAYVPVHLLGQTSEMPGVTRVRAIIPPQPNRVVK